MSSVKKGIHKNPLPPNIPNHNLLLLEFPINKNKHSTLPMDKLPSPNNLPPNIKSPINKEIASAYLFLLRSDLDVDTPPFI